MIITAIENRARVSRDVELLTGGVRYMPTFSYIALDIHGEQVKGSLEAGSANAAASQIREMGYYPTLVKEEKVSRTTGRVVKAKKAGGGGGLQMQIKIPGLTTRVGVRDLAAFTRQLATLIDAGLPVVRSLNVLKEQSKPGPLRDVLTDLVESIEGGSSFSEALARHPSTFSKLYVNMVKAGEIGGVLEAVLDRIAQFLEKEIDLRRKIRGAMMYPILVTVAIVGILAFLITFVIPTFKDMLIDFGGGEATLPVPTQILLGSVRVITGRDFVLPNIVWVIIGLILMVILFKVVVSKSQRVKYLVDTIKLKLLIFGPLVKKSAIARFSRTLGTLVNSGVPILQALNIVKETSGNEVLGRCMTTVHDSVREGESIARPLAESRFFPPLVVNMVDVGEETGSLDSMLIKVADAYEADVDVAVEGLSSTLEPLLIIGMGCIVGFIVVSLFLPLIQMAMMIGGM